MSIGRNFFFSAILTVANYVFPFLVYPYVARQLGPANLGICNFVDDIINYAVILSMMGVALVGTRSIAQAKGNKAMLNESFTALFVLTAIFTLVATAILVTVTLTVHHLQPFRSLLFIGLAKLWGNFFLIEWFYKGIEDFRYITIRTIAVKIGFVISVFILVRGAGDYSRYFTLLCLAVVANAAFNCFRASKFVRFKFNSEILKSYLPSFLILGVYILLNSMYTTFNVIYLGFESGDTEVGYYTTSTKIFKIILALYTAYSTVVLPRASALLSEGKHEDFKGLIHLSVHGLMLVAIPISIFGIIYSDGIISLIAGPEFKGSIIPMMIVMPLLFIIGYEQILVMQILTPLATDRAILINSIVGASVGIVGNILLVSHFAAVGSAIVWFAAEVAVLVTAQTFVNRYSVLHFPWRLLLRNIAAYLPYIAVAIAILFIPSISAQAKMLLGGFLLLPYFYLMQKKVLRNPVFKMSCDKLSEWISGNKK